MATVTDYDAVLHPAGPGFVLRDVPWSGYLKMLQVLGERHVHVTYDEGTMEVRMPSQRHEQAAQLLGLFIPRLAEALEVDYEPLGMTTWRRPDLEKGLESDQCYYIRNAAIVRQRDELDLERDPPPDLAVEVDITSSSLDRMAIYAELRVPEVWRYDGRRLTIYVLQPNGRYRASPTSLSFPGLCPADVERFLERGLTTPKLQWSREIQEWAQNELLPRRNAGGGQKAARKRRPKGPS
jgi:Uma2 family endonuclease